MQRRAFLYLSSVTAMALTVPALHGCGINDHEKATAQPFFFSHLADLKTITETGQAYRRAVPHENDQQTLTRLLLGNQLTSSTDSHTISAALDRQVVDDFKQGRTVTVSGWILALTEARQCALFSILKS